MLDEISVIPWTTYNLPHDITNILSLELNIQILSDFSLTDPFASMHAVTGWDGMGWRRLLFRASEWRINLYKR